MKAIRKENESIVAYVNKRDVQILNSISEIIDSRFFEEESIAKGIVDENGYYKITEPDNVDYLSSLSFIPYYDDLVDMDYLKLHELVRKNGVYSSEINAIFIKNELLSDEDITFLRTLDSVRKSDLDALEDADLLQKEFLKLCIRQQIRCYSYSVMEVINQKEKAMKEEEERLREERRHRFVKALKRIGSCKKWKKMIGTSVNLCFPIIFSINYYKDLKS